MLTFDCPSCGGKLQMPRELAGKEVRCSSCQAVVTAPPPGAGHEAIKAASNVFPNAADPSRRTGVEDEANPSPHARDDVLRRPKSNSGMVWLVVLIVALVVGLPLLVVACVFLVPAVGAMFFLVAAHEPDAKPVAQAAEEQVLVRKAEKVDGAPPKAEKPLGAPGAKNAAAAQVRVLTDACNAFKVKNARFPDALDQLLEKADGGPYLKNGDALVDPWGNRYLYDPTGPHNKGNHPDIWTVEPKSQERIGNWP